MLKSKTLPARRRLRAAIQLTVALVAGYVALTYRPIAWPTTQPTQQVEPR
jgi:hypothetical protein